MILKVTLTFGVNRKVNAYSFVYRLICQFITPSILDRITQNFQVWSLKKRLPVLKILRHQYFSIELSPLFVVGLSSNLLKPNQIDDLHLYFNMICDLVNIFFIKMEETFQSNTLDWSSLVIIFLSFFFSFIVQSYLRQFLMDSLQIFRI